MGRHALLEAPDAPAVTGSPVTGTPASHDAARSSDVRTVAQIIAQFRRDQGLRTMPARRAGDTPDADLPPTDAAFDTDAHVVVGPWSTPTTEHDSDDDTDEDDDRPAGPSDGDDIAPHPTLVVPAPVEADAARARREAAWQAALRPGGTPPQPRRRRATDGSSASAVIASLTAELAASHPGLLDGSPHCRRAAAVARRTAPAGDAASLRPVRVTAGLRGAALRVPALAHGWRVPTRTPLVLAGAVAVSVVVTDQAGLLTSTQAGAASTAAQQTTLAANVASDQTATTAAGASENARQASTRVSRLERTPLTAVATPGATTAGSGTAVTPAPPPDSVMKPGQTIPGDWVRPSAKGIYNSCFCARWGTMHEGIDFAAPLGSPILAVGDGVVVQAGPASGFGNWVIIKHANGDMTIYGHMRYYYVKVGQQVKAGQEIALVGAEGQSTGPHLHLGVKIGSTDGHDGTYVDPVPWLVARGIAVGSYDVNG